MTARTSAIEAISTHEVAGNQEYLEHAGEAIYGEYVFDERAQREYLAEAHLQAAAAHDRGPGTLRLR